jgi:hypothetical protein
MLSRKYEIINHFPNKTTHNIVKKKKSNVKAFLVSPTFSKYSKESPWAKA